jgi:hypothetical protein
MGLFECDSRVYRRGLTALLQAIAEKLIPGLQKSLRILMVSQITDSAPVTDGNDNSPVSVMQHVVRGDKRRAQVIEEFDGEAPPTLESRLADYLINYLYLLESSQPCSGVKFLTRNTAHRLQTSPC